MRLVKLATCSLNQWAMDFEGNLARIKESILQAKAQGAVYRVGPELEITGYGCEDHFHEQDTCSHAWECLAELLASDLTRGIVCDVGLPVEQGGVRYNCRAFLLDGKILLIRPKIALANDGNYRETRWFAGWKHRRTVVDLQLPDVVRKVTQQSSVPFGDAVLAFEDTTLACETCEELFTPASPHIDLALNGVEIISNGSGSHHQLRKLNTRMDLMLGATAKAGGIYLYANQQGCDGGRLYYDGCACIVANGDVLVQGSQFSLADVEVITAVVDLDTVASHRGAISSMREQASSAERIPVVRVPFGLTQPTENLMEFPTLPVCVRYHRPEEEIALGPACWLWDYLRRSGASGFLLPLSGGADSSSVAAICGAMCKLVMRAIEGGNAQVLGDAQRIGQYGKGESPASSEELAGRILHMVYMGSENSSKETQTRAARLSSQIGAYSLALRIDTVTSAIVALFATLFGKMPRFKVDGGSQAENLALQNIQARVRMVLAFLLAQLTPWARGRAGFLLVLGSANVDEGLRGYLTKYDCSSADINPIGGISKQDLRRFLRWGASDPLVGYPELAGVEAAPPTAELEPIRANYQQVDEVDMGMTYDELSLYGRLRKVFRCGPVSMFQHLCHRWQGRLTPSEVAQKVKDFFRFYSMNRHKMTTLTPSYHAESYSPEDNRYDLRQFLYNVLWPWQFRRIDMMVAAHERGGGGAPAAPAGGPAAAEDGVASRPQSAGADAVGMEDGAGRMELDQGGEGGGVTAAEAAGALAGSVGVPAAASGNPGSGRGA